jgi:hypothetical protein
MIESPAQRKPQTHRLKIPFPGRQALSPIRYCTSYANMHIQIQYRLFAASFQQAGK